MVAQDGSVVVPLRNRLFSTSDVANLFALSHESVLRARKQGLLRGARVGGRILYAAADVAAWINERSDGLVVIVDASDEAGDAR